MVIDDIQEFNVYLKSQINYFNIQLFTQYVNNLDSAIHNFEIKKFQQLLNEMKALKSELELLQS